MWVAQGLGALPSENDSQCRNVAVVRASSLLQRAVHRRSLGTAWLDIFVNQGGDLVETSLHLGEIFVRSELCAVQPDYLEPSVAGVGARTLTRLLSFEQGVRRTMRS